MRQRSQFGTRRPEAARGPRVQIDFEGKPLTAFAGETVAIGLLAGGVRIFSRSIKFHRPRSVFCLSGDCGSCLMRIDGQPNQRACRTLVHDGLRCERQNAWPSASFDVLAAADEMFAQGMDHHSLLTAPRPLNLAMQKMVQRLGGLGQLPDDEPPFASLPAGDSRHVCVLVVGAGPAGLAAATAAAAALAQREGRPSGAVLLIEAAARPGGSYLCDPRYGPAAADAAVAKAIAAGVEILTSAAAIGYYPEEVAPASPTGAPGFLAVATPQGMLKLSAERYIYATGGHEQNLLFIDNDRPGVLAGRAVGRLHTEYGLCVGQRPLIAGDGEYAEALAAALSQSGAQVQQVDSRRERIERALGRSWVNGAVLVADNGCSRQVDCDLIAVVQPPAPACELPHMHGVELSFDTERGFVVSTDELGCTKADGVFACGEVAGSSGVRAAALHGLRVGAAAVAREPG